MASATLVSLEEYLSTNYRPDCDLIDGHSLERNVGKYDQGNLQATLGAWFRSRRHEWNIRVSVEQRIRVSSSGVRIADVCVLSREQAIEQVFTQPPLICIEILSEGDTLRSTQPRIDDYARLGVPNIWIIDAGPRRGYQCVDGAMNEAKDGVLRVPGSPISISMETLFAELD